MDQYDKELEETVPEFEGHAESASHGALDISATLSAVQIREWRQVLGILAVAVLVAIRHKDNLTRLLRGEEHRA